MTDLPMESAYHKPIFCMKFPDRYNTYIYYMRKKIDKSKTFSIGSTITHYRKKKGVTQTELAEALGVTQRVISYYENPTTNLSIDIPRLPLTDQQHIAKIIELIAIKNVLSQAS